MNASDGFSPDKGFETMKNNTASYRRSWSGGFSLIELSIVMVIIGVIFSLMFGIFDPSMNQVRQAKNQVIVQNAVNALIGRAGAYKKLPTTLTGYQDAKQSALQYYYATGLDADNSICTVQSTGVTVTVTTGSYSVSDVAFVAWSIGNNGASNLTTGTGITIPVDSATFDDTVGWATLWELKAAAGCENRPMKITTTSVPAGVVSSLYGTAIFTPDGGTAPYTWCVEFPTLNTGVLTGNLSFSGTVPVQNTSGCTGVTWASGETDGTLQMTAGSALTSGDEGTHDFTVFLKDSSASPNTDSRRFTLYVK